jgi:hypothetical protein
LPFADEKADYQGEPELTRCASQRERIVALAAKYGVATIYAWREYVLAGGLMSNGTDLPEEIPLVLPSRLPATSQKRLAIFPC